MSLSRLLEIVNLLMMNKTLSAKYLADYFEVSTRTIYRDIDKLTLANIPIYSTHGKLGGFSMLEEYTLNKQLLDKDEQLSIMNALNEIPLSSNQNALNKLSALFNIEKREWIQVDFKPWHEMESTQTFNLIKEAILTTKKLEFIYHNQQGESSLKLICPFKIYFKSYGWYVVGYDIIKKSNRVYKITRLRNLTIKEGFDIAIFKNVDVDRLFYNPNYTPKPKVKVVLKIDKELMYRVLDEFADEEIEKYDDYLIVTTMRRLDEWLIQQLISYFNGIEVLEPLELKNDIKGILTKTLKKI